MVSSIEKGRQDPDSISEVEHVTSELTAEKFIASVAPEARGDCSVDDLPSNYFRSLPFIGSFTSVGLAYCTCLSGYVMISTSYPVIIQVFGPSASSIWIVLNIVLAQTITFTLNGRLSDIFGRRYFFIAGAAINFVGCIISGSAKSLNTVIGGNFVVGVGTGILQSEPIMFGEMIPNEYRYTVLGAAFALFSPLTAVSPGLARVLASNVSWRWIYYLTAIMSACCGLLQVFFYFPPNFHQLHRSSRKRNAIKHLDFIGILIFSGSLVSFVLGVSWGGQKYAWKSAAVIAPIILGAFGMILFALWENYVPLKEPLVNTYLFKNRNFICLTMVSGVGAMIFYALNIIYPQQLSAVWHEDSTSSGWLTCTIVGGAMLGHFTAAASVKWLSRWISLKWQLVATCVTFTAFTGGLAKITVDHKVRTILFSLISSAMIGLMEVITMAGAPLMVAYEDMGLANGIEFTVRGVLSSVSTSIYTTILTNKIQHYLSTDVAQAALGAGVSAENLPALLTYLVEGNKAGILQIPGMTPQILQTVSAATISALSKSYELIYLVSLAFGGLAIIFALLVDGKALKDKMTTDVARKLQPSLVGGNAVATKDSGNSTGTV